MLGKYSITLLLASAAADKYQLSVDGPCVEEPAFETLLPLLISTHKPLEGADSADHQYDYATEKSATCAGATKFTINKIRDTPSHPLVQANTDSDDAPRPLFPPQAVWPELSAVQAYNEVMWPWMVTAYGASFIPIPVIRQLIAAGLELNILLDVGPGLNAAIEGFDQVWGPPQENMTIGLVIFYFLAAALDFWGFVLGQVPLLGGLIVLIYGVSQGLTFGNSGTLFNDTTEVTAYITAGVASLLFGLGVSAINMPIQLVLAMFGGIHVHDIQSAYENSSAQHLAPNCNCNGAGDLVCCCCAAQFGQAHCECGPHWDKQGIKDRTEEGAVANMSGGGGNIAGGGGSGGSGGSGGGGSGGGGSGGGGSGGGGSGGGGSGGGGSGGGGSGGGGSTTEGGGGSGGGGESGGGGGSGGGGESGGGGGSGGGGESGGGGGSGGGGEGGGGGSGGGSEPAPSPDAGGGGADAGGGGGGGGEPPAPSPTPSN